MRCAADFFINTEFTFVFLNALSHKDRFFRPWRSVAARYDFLQAVQNKNVIGELVV